MSLNDLNEHGRAVLDGRGENLQKIAFIILVDQNAEFLDGLVIFLDLADAFGECFVIGVGHAQEFDAVLAELIHSVENVTSDDGNMLCAGREIVIEILFDLTLAFALGWFVDRELDAAVAVLHHLGH